MVSRASPSTSVVARPVKTFTHDGDDWQAMFTWGCVSREGYTIGVLFVAKEPTGKRTDGCTVSLQSASITPRWINFDRR